MTAMAAVAGRWPVAEGSPAKEAPVLAAARCVPFATPEEQALAQTQHPAPVVVPNDRPTILGGVAPEQRDSDETRILELPVGWGTKRGPWVESTQGGVYLISVLTAATAAA